MNGDLITMNGDLKRNIADIVLQIKTGRVIPIIGYDMLYNEFEDKHREKDFLKRLIKIHANDDNLESKYVNANTGYELLNAYYHDLPKKAIFKLQLSETIRRERFNWQLIPESFRKLVSIKHFKLFINATFTNTLELAFNSYRAKGTRQEEIKSSYSVLNYHPIAPDDLPQAAPSKFHIDLGKPIIYNLFGTHDEESGEYLLTDADYIELIHDLILDPKEEKLKNLRSYLNKAYLLFLGSNFPDWFFRFFIRVCVGDRLDSVPQIERKAVIDSLKTDESRSFFIKSYKIQTIELDCNTLIDEIYKAFLNEEGTPGILGDKGNNNVFVSYCRADEEVAKDIVKQFEEKFIEYFLDSHNLTTGDDLNDQITNAIDKSCVFLPIVSHNLQTASPYVWKEWSYALARKKANIWPVFKDFVDPDGLLPKEYAATSDLRSKILNKNNTLGIALGPLGGCSGVNEIPESKLKDIKEAQFLCRVSGDKLTDNN